MNFMGRKFSVEMVGSDTENRHERIRDPENFKYQKNSAGVVLVTQKEGVYRRGEVGNAECSEMISQRKSECVSGVVGG